MRDSLRLRVRWEIRHSCKVHVPDVSRGLNPRLSRML